MLYGDNHFALDFALEANDGFDALVHPPKEAF